MSCHQRATTSAGSGMISDRLASWVEVHEERCRDGRWYRVLVNHRDRRAITVSDEEADLVRQLCSPAGSTARTPNSAAAEALLTDLREGGFLSHGASAPPAGSTRRWDRLRKFAASLDLRSEHGGRLIAGIYRHGARLAFTRPAVLCQLAVATAGLAAVIHTLKHSARFTLAVHPGQLPFALTLSLVAIALHECAHGLVVIRNGRRVDAVGFKLHLGTPAFYVESIDALLLPRRQRLLQAGAGSWAEWQVTSLVALWAWIMPTPAALGLLHRFVILNSITVCSNLLPFVGLDGYLLFADAIGEPDLGLTSRGATGRLINRLLARQRVSARDCALAAYNAINGAVATVLLLVAAFVWYAMFGSTLIALAHHGPVGWTVLAALTVLLGRPMLIATVPRLTLAVHTFRELTARARFRLQWRWRIPAIEALAAHDPALRELDESRLGILAGTLVRAKVARTSGLPADAGPYTYLQRCGRRGRLAGQPAVRVVPTSLADTFPRGTVLVSLPTS